METPRSNPVKPTLEDILGSFAVEINHDRQTLEQYLTDYPEYALELVDFSMGLRHNETDNGEVSADSADSAAIDRAWLRFKNAVKPEVIYMLTNSSESNSCDLSERSSSTGRTTRMLGHALFFARAGRAVYVVAADPGHAEVMREQVQVMSGITDKEPLGIKFETATSLGNFDWDTLTLIGGHSNCEVLVDHFAIEQRFSRVFEMLHRFD